MNTLLDQPAGLVLQTLDNEMWMIRAAIDLVAAGGSPRVVLAGLRFVEPVLGQAREIAAAAGVQIVPIWTAAESATDLAVEPLRS